MIRIILIFIVLVGSVYLGIQLSEDPGYVLIAINHWTIETTAWVALVGLLLLFIVLHGLLVLSHRLGQLPEAFRQWRIKRRTQKAQSTTRQGLIEFSEGYWSSAKNHLIKALPDTDSPLLNYLTAARAAQEMGENQLRDDYLREAQQSMPDAKIAVELTQAQLQLANQQWEQALATLRHLQDLAPHHPYVLKLLMELYQEVRDWPQLIALLPDLQKNEIITGYAFEKLRHHTYLQAMSDLARIGNLDALTNVVNKLPKPLKYDPDLMACYCQFLVKNNQIVLAESVLRHCLRKEFSEKLVAIYGQFYIDEKQLAFAESLLKKHPNSAALNLSLGHLCIENNLWGKAKNYLEKSISLEENPVAYAEMGKLHERFGEQEAACSAYRQGLRLITQPSETP
jgi:HemY protein